MAAAAPLEPLASAVAVLCCDSGSKRSQVGELAHAVNLVSAFLDGATPSRWSLERACEKGFGLRMLKRLAAHEANDAASSTTPARDPFYHAFLAAKGLTATIKRADDVDVVRWICSEYAPRVVPVKPMILAASFGRMRVLQWLLEKYPGVQAAGVLAEEAATRGQFEVFQHLAPQLQGIDVGGVQKMISAAVFGGHVGILRQVCEIEILVDAETDDPEWEQASTLLTYAIANGFFEVARFLVDLGCKIEGNVMLPHCADRGDLEMIKWLHAQELTQDTVGWIHAAATAGHLHIVKWAHEHLPTDKCTAATMDEAARLGHLDVVQWLHEHRTEGCTSKAMDGAAEAGNFEIVQWLHANRSEGCTTKAMDQAAARGHLQIVRWLHANRTEGCTAEAMTSAAGAGHLEVVQFLHANRAEGCTVDAMDHAAGAGHLPTVEWLHVNRTEGCTTNAMDWASAGGHLEVARWLHENRSEGCTTIAMDWAATGGHFGVVEWLHENRTEGCTELALNSATSLRVLEWLHVHQKGCTELAMIVAVENAHFEKLLFLKEKRLNLGAEAFALDEFLSGDFETVSFEIYQWLIASYSEQIDFSEADWDSVQCPKLWQMFIQFDPQCASLFADLDDSDDSDDN